MEQIKTTKVTWICHFSNEDVRNKLPLSKYIVSDFLRSILGKNKSKKYVDFAPWVTNLISEFEKLQNIELHIIAPHKGLTRLFYDFELNGVSYHFFKVDLPILDIKIPLKFFDNIKIKFLWNRIFVKFKLKKIKPDIVNLIGAENPYYSVTSLDIHNIPVFVSLQTIYSNPDRKKHSNHISQLIWDVEKEVHKHEMYFGCSSRMHRDLLLQNNPDAIIYKMLFPITKPSQVLKKKKIYDFVFFAATVDKRKGIEDVIEALAIVKEEKSNVTFDIVGSCINEYKQLLLSKINKLNLNDNICFHDYFPIHADMHQHIVQANFAVLPVKLDSISGAVIEAILLGLPVVTNKTSKMPFLNKDGESVLLSEIDNVEMLAENMIKLVKSPELAKALRENARKFILNEYDEKRMVENLLRTYESIINHYHHGINIPNELLFDINEFPIYQ